VVEFVLILILAVHSLQLRSRIEELSERVHALEFVPPSQPVVPPPLPPPLPRFVPTPAPARAYVPGPSLADRIREKVGNEEWEALIGGSILNKVGALVLVIGIALFLGFSFGRISPAGRAAMAATVSVAILGCGVWAEREARYRFFARGLIGAGWAALYATAYAIYAIPAARVIDNPPTGSLILLAVGAGMIVHSLRYRAQAVTGVAYFSAFAALAVTPSSPFAVLSLIPLAASVLWLAAKFEWYPMALFGLFATYGTCISRGSSDAPLAEVQTLFLAYWLLFELFDLLCVKRKVAGGGVEWIFYGNLAGFVGLSYFAWAHQASSQLWLAAACGSGLYFADAVARGVLRSRFEAPALASALLAGASLVANVAGVWLAFGLAVEAETIYLLGVRFASPFLEYLGIAAFAHSLIRLALTPFGKTWAPPLVFEAALFYVNRAVRRPNVVMSTAAAVLVAAALAIEMSLAHLGAAWIVSALVLFEIGKRFDLVEFPIQAYALASAGALVSMVWGDVACLSIGLAVILGCAMLLRRPLESSGIAVGLAFMLLWRAVPGDYVGLSWLVLMLGALELGLAKQPEEMQGFAAPAGLVAMCGLIATHNPDWVKFAAGAIVGVAAIRVGHGLRRHGFVAGAAALFLWGAFLVTPELYITMAWTAIGVAVLELGFREVALGVFGLICLRLAGVDLRHTPLVSMPVGISGVYWLWHRVRNVWISVTASALVAALLWTRVSGEMLTVAWGFEGLALLGCGFGMRERALRLQGLAMLLACILKLFLYDLRNLETLPRILSFIALGAIMLGVSWIYTRFRDQLKSLL
jgi:hypothetical protein